MKKIYASLLLVLLASTSKADITPDWLWDNANYLASGTCTDNETGDEGMCFLFTDGDTHYMVFVQNGVPIFVRRTTPMGYEQVWPYQAPGGRGL